MSVTHYTRDRITVDSQAIQMAVLFLFVQVAAVWMTLQLQTADVSPETPGNVEGASAGAAWAAAEVVAAIVILGAVLLYQRAPDWVQKLIRWNGIALLLLSTGGNWATADVLGAGMVMISGIISIYVVTDHFGVWWVVNNGLAVLVAIISAAVVALALNVTAIGVALLGLALYDHVFANKRDWMFVMADWAMSLRLPMLFVKPDEWRFQWSDLVESLGTESDDEEEDDDTVTWGIGTADLLLPAAFVSAIAAAPQAALTGISLLTVIVVIVGVTAACFRLRWEMLNHGSGAGLPSLSTAAVGAFLVVEVVVTAAEVVA